MTITAIDNGSMEKLASIEQDAERYVEDIYVQDDKLVLFGTLGRQVGNSEDSEAYDGYYENNTYVQVYDISDPSNPKEIGNMEQSGGYNTSRIVDGYVYVLSRSILTKTMLQQEICGIFRKCKENLSKQKIFICHRKQKEMNIRSLQHFH